MKLYYSVLCPYSRKVIISLEEKKIPYEMCEEKIWEKSEEFIGIEQTGIVPVIIDNSNDKQIVVSWSIAIDEYLESTYRDVKLYGEKIEQILMTRKLVSWFDQKFYSEVIMGIVFEKIIKRFSKEKSCPNSVAIRNAIERLYYHMEYMSWLLESNDWLAGNFFSLADITAAAHISTIDYLNQVPWSEFPDVKIWYGKIKSRPSFRKILAERISTLAPAEHYTNLDF